jgi:hypothetical protein
LDTILKICTKCKKPKSINEFYKGNDKDGFTYWCKKCHNEVHIINDKSLVIARKLLGICVICGKNPPEESFDRCVSCGKNYRDYAKDWRFKLKLETINRYGGTCICCGESRIEFLTIDHMDNNGAEHRKEIKSAGGVAGFYSWLKKNNWPEEYQILCWNCNSAKYHYKICPHQLIRD